jgi:hypothetical protein
MEILSKPPPLENAAQKANMITPVLVVMGLAVALEAVAMVFLKMVCLKIMFLKSTHWAAFLPLRLLANLPPSKQMDMRRMCKGRMGHRNHRHLCWNSLCEK